MFEFEFGGERDDCEVKAERSTQTPEAVPASQAAATTAERASESAAMKAGWAPFEIGGESTHESKLEVEFEGWCTDYAYLVDAGKWLVDERLRPILSEPIRLAQFTLRNMGEEPVYFWGDWAAGPRYRTVPLEELNQRRLPFRCGNGQVKLLLQPHEELPLDVYSRDDVNDFILELVPYREDGTALETLRSEVVEASSER